jgi:hypothetical protein
MIERTNITTHEILQDEFSQTQPFVELKALKMAICYIYFTNTSINPSHKYLHRHTLNNV